MIKSTALAPGDVIHTGTPEGVALSGRFSHPKKGDVMEFETDGSVRRRPRVGQA
ncbi:fumarylacetoacetate hydrolase family protein [Streptomyces sp. NPDC058001]|uniref:fumarylacetoacetate hydrolase family protein n=1 Tax=Streptomyces sp. NPDC058001 TaxID=3346300 RepID=UPI0036EEE124